MEKEKFQIWIKKPCHGSSQLQKVCNDGFGLEFGGRWKPLDWAEKCEWNKLVHIISHTPWNIPDSFKD